MIFAHVCVVAANEQMINFRILPEENRHSGFKKEKKVSAPIAISAWSSRRQMLTSDHLAISPTPHPLAIFSI
jgi:hypothetical protein